MLLSNIYKNVCRLSIRRFGGIAGARQYEIHKCYESFYPDKLLLNYPVITSYLASKRFNSDNKQNNPPAIRLPPLLTDKEIIYVPSVIKGFSSSYRLHVELRGRLDPEFDLLEFMDGAKQAMAFVSSALSREDYDSLYGLVANGVIEQLREKISNLSDEQKKLIAIDKRDFYSIFLYSIDVITEGEDEDKQKKFAEILVVAYALRDFHKRTHLDELSPMKLPIVIVNDYADEIYLFNYRFRRDYTDGTNEPWIVIGCNEIMPTQEQ